jgi:hypothetical protein
VRPIFAEHLRKNKRDPRLGPYYINLRDGEFATTGKYSTTPQDVDKMFSTALEPLAAAATSENPLRIMIWAHGGLVSEVDAIAQVSIDSGYWRANMIYPIFFVWQTSVLETLRDKIFGRLYVEHAWTDALIEDLLREAGGKELWSGIKDNARNGSKRNGGAFYVANKLGALVGRHPKKVELHAVGHSAGSIFHSFFIPEALKQGIRAFKSAQFLAPAINLTEFGQRYTELLAIKAIDQMRVFAMKDSLEQADPTCHPYHKSLLYLIHNALEEERKTDLLGLQISIRKNPDLSKIISFIFSKTDSGADLDSRSQAATHGGFHYDGETMDSVSRRILRLTNQQKLPQTYPPLQPPHSTLGLSGVRGGLRVRNAKAGRR